jgi:hypothetical protein
METFLQRDSDVFATQLYAFLASGLSVKAYDVLVFGPEVASQGVGGSNAAPNGDGNQGEVSRREDADESIYEDDGDDFEGD